MQQYSGEWVVGVLKILFTDWQGHVMRSCKRAIVPY